VTEYVYVPGQATGSKFRRLPAVPFGYAIVSRMEIISEILHSSSSPMSFPPPPPLLPPPPLPSPPLPPFLVVIFVVRIVVVIFDLHLILVLLPMFASVVCTIAIGVLINRAEDLS
jgi:hypothetical protein